MKKIVKFIHYWWFRLVLQYIPRYSLMKDVKRKFKYGVGQNLTFAVVQDASCRHISIVFYDEFVVLKISKVLEYSKNYSFEERDNFFENNLDFKCVIKLNTHISSALFHSFLRSCQKIARHIRKLNYGKEDAYY